MLLTSKTLQCNGATIQSTGGPIRASASGVVLTVNDCVLQGTGWALLGAVNGGALVVRNTQMTGNGANSAIYAGSATVDVSGATLTSFRWGLNLENATASVFGTSITETTYGVQNVAGHATIDTSYLRNRNAANPGAGVSVISSATYPTRVPVP